MSEDQVRVEGLPYTFPKSELEGLVRPGKGDLHVRLRPPPGDIVLMIDERSDREAKKSSVPAIPGVSMEGRQTRVIEIDGDTVVCIDSPNHLNCGIELSDEGVRWTVRFDDESLPNFSQVKSFVEEKIRTYRGTK